MADSSSQPPPYRHVLVVNDDGIHAPGLALMLQAVQRLSGVEAITVLAPESEASGTSQAITSGRPLMLLPRSLPIADERTRVFALRALPTDCTRIGLSAAFPEVETHGVPGLVLSGVNRGANLGHHVHYSGTVSAAMEAAGAGVLGIAVSQVYRFQGVTPEEPTPHPSLVPILAELLAHWLRSEALQPDLQPTGSGLVLGERAPGIALNVNLPPGDLSGMGLGDVAYVPHAGYYYRLPYERRETPGGITYFWPGRDLGPPHAEETAGLDDYQTISQGKIAVTPLTGQITARGVLDQLNGERRV